MVVIGARERNVAGLDPPVPRERQSTAGRRTNKSLHIPMLQVIGAPFFFLHRRNFSFLLMLSRK